MEKKHLSFMPMLLYILAISAATFLTGHLSITFFFGESGFAWAWFANAFAVICILQLQKFYSNTPLLLLVTFQLIPNYFTNYINNIDQVENIFMTTINVIEIGLIVRIFYNKPLNAALADIKYWVSRIVIILLAISLIAGGYFSTRYESNFLLATMGWFLSDSIAYLLFMFLFLGLTQKWTNKTTNFSYILSFATIVLWLYIENSSLETSLSRVTTLLLPLGLLSLFLPLTLFSLTAVFITIVELSQLQNFLQTENTSELLLLAEFCFLAAITYALSLQRAQIIANDSSLKTTLTELNEHREQQSKLFAIIGHELRTPAAILKHLLDEEDMKNLNNGPAISTTVDHLLDVLDDMRAISQPKFAIESKPKLTNTIQCLESATNLVDRISSEKRLKVLVETPVSEFPALYYNAQLLSQITMNLIRNAAYYSKGSLLRISPRIVSETDNVVTISVLFSDNGVGIPQELKAKLFNAFERGDTSNDGTGLGLHLSKKCAQEHLGGDLLLLDSDTGASFELTFKASKIMVNAINDDQPDESISLKGMSILYAEDNLTIRMTTEVMLKREGVLLTVAEDGSKALEAFEKNNFDLVLTDIFMPNMNGYEFTRTLRERGYTKPIFGITASSVGEEIDDLIAAGATCSLVKPLAIKDIKQAIARCQQNKQ